jgi:hypothetical protein
MIFLDMLEMPRTQLQIKRLVLAMVKTMYLFRYTKIGADVAEWLEYGWSMQWNGTILQLDYTTYPKQVHTRQKSAGFSLCSQWATARLNELAA